MIYNAASDLKHQFVELVDEWLPQVPLLAGKWNFLLHMRASWVFFFFLYFDIVPVF